MRGGMPFFANRVCLSTFAHGWPARIRDKEWTAARPCVKGARDYRYKYVRTLCFALQYFALMAGPSDVVYSARPKDLQIVLDASWRMWLQL